MKESSSYPALGAYAAQINGKGVLVYALASGLQVAAPAALKPYKPLASYAAADAKEV